MYASCELAQHSAHQFPSRRRPRKIPFQGHAGSTSTVSLIVAVSVKGLSMFPGFCWEYQDRISETVHHSSPLIHGLHILGLGSYPPLSVQDYSELCFFSHSIRPHFSPPRSSSGCQIIRILNKGREPSKELTERITSFPW